MRQNHACMGNGMLLHMILMAVTLGPGGPIMWGPSVAWQVSRMWQHSSHPDVFSTLPASEESGWLLQSDSNYIIDWKSSEVQLNIRDNIEFLADKGCDCNRGCKTLQYGCRKRSWSCEPGCLCQGCTNVNTEELESLPLQHVKIINGSYGEYIVGYVIPDCWLTLIHGMLCNISVMSIWRTGTS